MNKHLEELPDEIFEEIVCEYEGVEEIDIDEIIANLKSNISDYLCVNPDDSIFKKAETSADHESEDD